MYTIYKLIHGWPFDRPDGNLTVLSQRKIRWQPTGQCNLFYSPPQDVLRGLFLFRFDRRENV